MSVWLRVGGVSATEIAAHTPPTWETLADGGCGTASFAMALSPRAQHQALRKGSLVEIMAGPIPIYTGVLTEPDRTTWECHAVGLSTRLRTRLALDGVGNSTRNLGTAITRAISVGSPVTNPQPVTGTAAGDTGGNPVKLGTLMDDYAEQTGQRWGVDGFRRIYMRPDPIAPRWITSPGSLALGMADDDVTNLLAGRYDTGTAYATAFGSIGSGDVEDTADLTGRGTLTEAAANAIVAGMLQRTGTVQWTNGVTIGREQLTTVGGTPANLLSVRGGQLVRTHGLGYARVSALWLDFVIGKTRYTAGQDSIYLEPVNKAVRSAREVAAATASA